MLCYNFGNPKVADFDIALVNENVFGFNVSVDNTVLFEELQGYDHLCDESL